MPHMDFLEGVREAIRDETEAAAMYLELAGMAPNRAFRARIRCFAAEERRHSRLLSALLSEGSPNMIDPGPDDWDIVADDNEPPEAAWMPGLPQQPPFAPGHPMPPQPPAPGPTVPGAFAEGVAMAIEGEVHAIEDYAQLAALAPRPAVRERILCIQKDEMYHLVSFEFIQSIIQSM